MSSYDRARCLVLVLLMMLFAGCNGQDATRDPAVKNNGKQQKGSASAVETAIVKGIKYREEVELPGATVHGLETTRLMAKVGGFVKTIGTVPTHVNAPAQNEIVLTGSKVPEEEEVDTGSIVEAGTVLAVLDIPEMQDRIDEAKAHIDAAIRQVDQQTAAVDEAIAKRKLRDAEVKQVEAHRAEKQANVDIKQTIYRRIARLVEVEKAIGRESLDEADYALKAAEAALASVVADILSAKANVAAARANVAKTKADKLRALSQVKVAEAAAKTLQTMTKYATIRAPYKGLITERLVDHGTFVRPATSNSGATALFVIKRIDEVRIVANVPSTEADRVQKWQLVEFHNIGGLPGVVVTGRVTRTGLARHSGSRTMPIHVNVKNPAPRKGSRKTIELLPGLFGTLRVLIKDWKALPVVPASAVATDANGQPYVVVVESDGKRTRRDVETVFAHYEDVGIRSGVEIGDVVVAKDLDKLKNVQNNSAESG